MLGRIHSFLFSFFIFLVGVFWTTCLANAMCGYNHLSECSVLPAGLVVKLLALFSIAVAWSYFRKAKSKKQAALWRPIWLGVVRKYLVVRIGRDAFLCFSSLCLAIMSFFFVFSSFCQFTSAISFCADNAGDYELAERWYRDNPERKPGQSMGIKKYSSVPETEHERRCRNIAVARIYGDNSLEMARRLFFVGMNIEMSTPDQRGYNDCALSWFEKSYVVALANNYNGVALDDLCQMVLINFDSKKPSNCRPYLVNAAKLISRFPESYLAMSGNSRCLFPFMATKIGDVELAKKFREVPIPMKPRKGFLDATSVAILTASAILPLVCSRLGFITPLLIELLVIVLYRRSRSRLVRSRDLPTSMVALNRLIDLDLYRGNYSGALRHSENLLQLVGVNHHDVRGNADEPWSHQHWPLILGRQIAAVTIISLLCIMVVKT